MKHYKKRRPTKTTKSFVRLLALSKKPSFTRALVKEAPDDVIKTISDAALNAIHGRGINISKRNRSQFAKQRRTFKLLTTRTVALAKKRRALVGRGFLALLPLLLSTVLGAVGPAIFRK